jgi:stage V sporulation protein S
MGALGRIGQVRSVSPSKKPPMTAPPRDTPPTVGLLVANGPGRDEPTIDLAQVEVLKVSARSHPTSVAGAIAGVIRGRGVAEIHVVGAGALNQAIKGVAVARGFVAEAGLDLVCTPSFVEVEIDGERRTAMRLTVDDRGHRLPDPAPQPGTPAANP